MILDCHQSNSLFLIACSDVTTDIADGFRHIFWDGGIAESSEIGTSFIDPNEFHRRFGLTKGKDTVFTLDKSLEDWLHFEIELEINRNLTSEMEDIRAEL